MSLKTPDLIRTLQRKLYEKAKTEPGFRFYLLYDKVWRADILNHAYALARANKGAPGVDGMTFDRIEASGLENWLTRLGEEVRREDVPVPGGAAGDDPKARRRGASSRYPDDKGPGGANRREIGTGADLRGGSGGARSATGRDAARAMRSRRCDLLHQAGSTPTWSTPI